MDSGWVWTVLLAGLFLSLCRIAWVHFSCVMLLLRLVLLPPLVHSYSPVQVGVEDLEVDGSPLCVSFGAPGSLDVDKAAKAAEVPVAAPALHFAHTCLLLRVSLIPHCAGRG